MKLHRLVPALLVTFAACGDSPVRPRERIEIFVDGRLERGSIVSLRVERDGVPLAPGLFNASADPESAVEWQSPTSALLLRDGQVRFIAQVGASGGTRTVNVALPPSLLFESVQGGNRDIWRVALDGGDVGRVTDDGAEDRSPTSAGGTVYFLSHRVSPAAVFSAPPVLGTPTRVTTPTLEFTGAVASPDGTRLAFTRPVGGVAKVWISAIDGTNPRRVSTTPGGVIEIAPAWSHDGSRLAFVSTVNGDADIFHVAATGGEPQLAAGGAGGDFEPAWSPDGQRIVFARGPDNQLDLHVANITTGAVTPLTSATGNEARPVWLSDGRIVFSRGTLLNELAWIDPAQPEQIHAISLSIPLSSRAAELR